MWCLGGKWRLFSITFDMCPCAPVARSSFALTSGFQQTRKLGTKWCEAFNRQGSRDIKCLARLRSIDRMPRRAFLRISLLAQRLVTRVARPSHGTGWPEFIECDWVTSCCASKCCATECNQAFSLDFTCCSFCVSHSSAFLKVFLVSLLTMALSAAWIPALI
jgi:hypothetical protein